MQTFQFHLSKIENNIEKIQYKRQWMEVSLKEYSALKIL